MVLGVYVAYMEAKTYERIEPKFFWW